MMKSLRWAWISLFLGSCCIVEPEIQSADLKPVALPQFDVSDSGKELGWVEIKGVLNQSFVQGKDNQEYLYRNADGTTSIAGANFMDYRCTFDSENIIIYGHSSRTSEILFTPLMKYLDEEFARSHDQIHLKLEDEIRTYQLFSVFLFHVKQSSENDWMIVHYERDFLFEKAVERIRDRSRFRFDPQDGNQLLTLVTCNTENHDERLIVVGIGKKDD